MIQNIFFRTPLFLAAILSFSKIAFSQTSTHPCASSKMNSISRENLLRSLVSDDHKALMAKYDVNFYFLDIALERTSTYISGNVSINANVTAAFLDTFAFELHNDLTIDSIFINNQKHSNIIRNNGGVKIPLISQIANANPITAQIFYKGLPPNGGSAAIGNGMSNETSPSWGNQVTWSLSESYVAYEWWPCKQLLEDKADSCKIHITTDIENKAGSNGILEKVDTLANNKVKFQWKNSHPINYYLISVAVAKYVDYTIYANPSNSPQPIMIQNYVYDNPGTLTNFQAEIDQTVDFIELFSELYGLYPFYDEKYGHCMAPLSGGMEHQTMTTLGWFEFTLVAHELGHQWFGDNVTCATWNDIWVNEGFASYSEYLALEYIDPSNKDSWMNDAHSDIMSSPDGSIYVADITDSQRIFDSRLTYNKGAAIIHTLRFELNNDSLFFAILKNYQQQFKDKVASTNDFKTVAENISGQNFTYFFDQWYYGEGFPTIDVKWNQTNDTLVLELAQTASMPSITPFFKTYLELKIKRNAMADTTVRLLFDWQNKQFKFPLTGSVTSITIDPNNWVLNQNGTVQKDADLVYTNIKNNLISTNKLSLFPNPANSEFRINGLNSTLNYQITLFDLTGKEVLNNPNYSEGNISVTDLDKGVYFVKIRNEKHTETLRFIKQ